MVTKLSPLLRAQLNQFVYGRLLSDAPFLVWVTDTPQMVQRLCNTMQSEFFDRADAILEVGQVRRPHGWRAESGESSW